MTREQLEKELDRAYSEQHRAESLFRNDGPYVGNKTYDKLWQNVQDANNKVYELSRKIRLMDGKSR
ncbi:MAG TPA: hypothetical protein DCM40_00200 [Maribacter sp.]|nr:hypothetical protein [Maribacter sp.]|tara:strand:- start:189 stop:386 length:198 start_codon:yes stop_codon:yes gene_type:complete